jgi:hypothetical protein
MSASEEKSELAQVLRQIELEYQAAYMGLHGPSAGSAQHDFIQAKMQRIHERYEVMARLIGPEAANEHLCRINDASYDRYAGKDDYQGTRPYTGRGQAGRDSMELEDLKRCEKTSYPERIE